MLNEVENSTANYISLNAGTGLAFNYPDTLIFNGAGITQSTSGPTSSVHLKVKINGIDYVIQLRNP